jgi:hypothetical protein
MTCDHLKGVVCSAAWSKTNQGEFAAASCGGYIAIWNASGERAGLQHAPHEELPLGDVTNQAHSEQVRNADLCACVYKATLLFLLVRSIHFAAEVEMCTITK